MGSPISHKVGFLVDSNFVFWMSGMIVNFSIQLMFVLKQRTKAIRRVHHGNTTSKLNSQKNCENDYIHILFGTWVKRKEEHLQMRLMPATVIDNNKGSLFVFDPSLRLN